MFALNLPINNVSFGQVSIGLLREIRKRGLNPDIFLIGDKADVTTQNQDPEFNKWVSERIQDAADRHDRSIPVFKLWHLNGSLNAFSKKQTLLTFHETDSPTKTEINIARNQDNLLVTSRYTKSVFEQYGVNVNCAPLYFDSFNFWRKEKQYFRDDRIVFNLCGKFEKRKHHAKIIQAWAKRFGKDKRYYLQCAIYNSFLKPEDNERLFTEILNGEVYFNIQYLGFMQSNSLYNEYLNSGNIIIGMSGGEGWGLPEFHSVAIGKHGVILDAHGYKEWANSDNSIMVNPSGKIDAYDGIFFKQGERFNQGQIFDWSEDEFISACERALDKFRYNPVNENGMELQNRFSVAKTFDKISDYI